MAHARTLIARFDIRTPSVETPIARLSGGNIQKVLLARELSGPAKAVIFNKPTYGLDVQNIAGDATAHHANAARAGIATILISTDLEELLELSRSDRRDVARAAGRHRGERRDAARNASAR